MDVSSHAKMLEAARRDRQERSRRQAQHCVMLAMVTDAPLAAELIDAAIKLQAESAKD